MAFTTRRGRPPKQLDDDPGTAELRLKHALRLTAEPIDRCLERQLITQAQHWCGLHLRWLYTVRYGAPIVTTRYVHRDDAPTRGENDPVWRHEREQEYRTASTLLKDQRVYEPVMRLCVYNESPVFLNETLHQRAWEQPALADQLDAALRKLQGGMDVLVTHWQRE